jgi:hypothetical protein
MKVSAWWYWGGGAGGTCLILYTPTRSNVPLSAGSSIGDCRDNCGLITRSQVDHPWVGDLGEWDEICLFLWETCCLIKRYYSVKKHFSSLALGGDCLQSRHLFKKPKCSETKLRVLRHDWSFILNKVIVYLRRIF